MKLFDRKLLKNLDYVILIVVFILAAIGLIMIASATNSNVSDFDKYAFVKKQAVSFGIGLVLMIIAMSIDYNVIGNFIWYIYGINIVMLLIVKFFGKEINGAKSWIKIGGFSLQPSEFSKVFMILFTAKIIYEIVKDHDNDINIPKNLIGVLALCAVPLALILSQPDFGTAMVIIAIIGVILYAAKLSYKYFFTALGLVVVSAPLLWFFKLKPYQKDRIRVFLDPSSDPQNKGFQVIQSKIAIGSGQFFGKGLFQGVQTQMGYLPFKESDFIFSVIGEELGFVCCAVLLLLFGILLLKLIDIARNAKEVYGSLIVIGIATMIGVHVFQNIGMTIGIMPITGITLPFISYGGSSLFTSMIAIGLVLNVGMRRHKINF
jgi:rod shape determining protein RodA